VNSIDAREINRRTGQGTTRGTTRVATPQATRRRMANAAFLLVGLALAFATLRDAHAGTYKWTDDKGIVHYADKVPIDAVNRASVELDSRGMALKKTEAALTAEQLRAKAQDVEKQRQATKEREETDRRDRALLSSYTREADIDLARNRAVGTIDGQLQSARVYVAQLTRRQQELLEKKIQSGAKGAPPAVERELESIEAELAKTNELVATRKKESQLVASRYDLDKQRWRELQAVADANAAGERNKVNSLSTAEVGGTAPTVLPASGAR
jgi:hypothetical protein